jgi:hypothetical protein
MNKMVPLLWALLVASFTFVTVSLAQDSNVERDKARIVKWICAITYGAEEIKCYSPQKSEQLLAAVAKFKKSYPELMNLVQKSPYWDEAKKALSNIFDSAKEREYDNDCQFLLNTLQEFTETESGRKGVVDIIAQLKK